ncbi:MAG TPA: methyltransferase domain-containing protein [Dehalococcoidia bacterium]|nr:methyltransferase domain-containing protein [Dehalococcoidia bacterium]
MTTNEFNPEQYKAATQQRWQEMAPRWHKWSPFLSELNRDLTNQMLEMAGIRAGFRVLDIAAGDGDMSIIAAHRVGPDGYVLATDISSNLLAYAASAAGEAGLAHLETRVMDGENLELEDNSFDAVICRSGLMLMPDPKTAMAEIYRVLRLGGRLSAFVSSTPDKNPWFGLSVGILRKHAQLPPAPPGSPGTFSLGAPGVFEGIFHEAGFQRVVTHYVSGSFPLSSAAECVEFLKDIGLNSMLASLSEDKQQQAWAEVEQALSQLEGPDGFVSPVEGIIGAGLKSN